MKSASLTYLFSNEVTMVTNSDDGNRIFATKSERALQLQSCSGSKSSSLSDIDILSDTFSVSEFRECAMTVVDEEEAKALNLLIHGSVQEGLMEKVDKLLSHSYVDVNNCYYGENLLMTAIRCKHTDIAKLLLENGADGNWKKKIIEYKRNERRFYVYETNCREMAYENNMLEIVEIIDYLNGELFPFLDPPDFTFENRIRRVPTPESIVSLHEEFFEGFPPLDDEEKKEEEDNQKEEKGDSRSKTVAFQSGCVAKDSSKFTSRKTSAISRSSQNSLGSSFSGSRETRSSMLRYRENSASRNRSKTKSR